MMSRLRDRPTADLIVVIFTVVVAFVVVMITIVAIGAVMFGGDVGVIRDILGAVGELTGSLIALIVGYVAGRGVGSGGNGSAPKKE